MNPVTMLDQLSDFQAQADYLEMKRQELINEVKIPAEVLAAQDEANKKRKLVEERLWTRQRAQNQEKEAALSTRVRPELPPEYVAAMEAYRLEGLAIERCFDDMMQEDQKMVAAEKAKIDADLQAKVADVYKQVEIRKAEINTEFSEKASSVKDNIDKLTAEIKAAVKVYGQTVKGQFLMAKWVKGRDGGWDTAKLEGYALAHPEILTAKKPDGEPSVSICKL